MRTDSAGVFRRMVAGLLVLAMLALSGAPALAAPPADHGHAHGHHRAAHGCIPSDGQATPPPHGPTQPIGPYDKGAAALACSIAAQCPPRRLTTGRRAARGRRCPTAAAPAVPTPRTTAPHGALRNA